MIFFNIMESNLGIAPIRDSYVAAMTSGGARHALLILRKGLTPPAAQAVRDLYRERGMLLDVFKEEMLMYDILKHRKVPVHRLLSPEEKQTLLAKLHVTEGQLMALLFNDPIARYMGLKSGDVVEIIRSLPTAHQVTYRIVRDIVD